jgi:Double zinc ribbon
MLAEAVAAAAIAGLVLWLVLQPLISPHLPVLPAVEPLDPEETPKGIALTALKEIEFDRETGKLSESDYELLKARYTAAALEAIRFEGGTPSELVSDDVESMVAARVRTLRSASATAPSDTPTKTSSANCLLCGPRPEPDAVFCSTCGRRLPDRSACGGCGATLLPGSKYCEGCGRQVAA